MMRENGNIAAKHCWAMKRMLPWVCSDKHWKAKNLPARYYD